MPPNHVASSTAGKKRKVRTPKLCSGNVTAVQIATNKTERPYRQTPGATRGNPKSAFGILNSKDLREAITPVKVYRSSARRATLLSSLERGTPKSCHCSYRR